MSALDVCWHCHDIHSCSPVSTWCPLTLCHVIHLVSNEPRWHHSKLRNTVDAVRQQYKTSYEDIATERATFYALSIIDLVSSEPCGTCSLEQSLFTQQVWIRASHVIQDQPLVSMTKKKKSLLDGQSMLERHAIQCRPTTIWLKLLKQTRFACKSM
jgi:hypothetical protein